MNEDQIEICNAFGAVRALPGTFDKRFMNSLFLKSTKAEVLTEKQNIWMFKLLYKYRNQLKELYQKHQNNPFCNRNNIIDL